MGGFASFFSGPPAPPPPQVSSAPPPPPKVSSAPDAPSQTVEARAGTATEKARRGGNRGSRRSLLSIGDEGNSIFGR